MHIIFSILLKLVVSDFFSLNVIVFVKSIRLYLIKTKQVCETQFFNIIFFTKIKSSRLRLYFFSMLFIIKKIN